MMNRICFTLSVCCLSLGSVIHTSATEQSELLQLSQEAISPNIETANRAIAKLRAVGPTGLQTLIKAHGSGPKSAIEIRAEQLRALGNFGAQPSSAPLIIDPAVAAKTARIEHAIAQVAGQYNAHQSGLYWYTDLIVAKDAAKNEQKPILSLRMLGNLNEEFSCANSRFFRTTLYTNLEISKYLQENYILHWESVRPVPVVTIDFGDGRKLKRTLTGNSIHYLLDSHGRPVDALPGLFGPKAFLRHLQTGHELATSVDALGLDSFREQIREHHRKQLATLLVNWQSDLMKLAKQYPQQLPKFSVNETEELQRTALVNLTTEAHWPYLATLHWADSELDPATYLVIQKQMPPAAKALPLAVGKSRVETPLLRLVRTLRNSISLDSVKNEYLMHSQIHEWFAETTLADTLEPFNDVVYAGLFLTPKNDPWLGLADPSVYTGLKNNGLVTSN